MGCSSMLDLTTVSSRERPALLTPLAAQPGIPGTNEEKAIFSMELMNDDYSGPAPSTTFTVGSKISLRATVAVRTDAPQQIFLNECVMTESSDPYLANETYTIITDEGCLLESKYGNATFLPREKPSEIRLSLAAFGFADTEEVYLHCKLVSWQVQKLDVDMKACYYRKDKRKWELLDDSSRSDICSCCDSICQQRASTFSYLIAFFQMLGYPQVSFNCIFSRRTVAECCSWSYKNSP
ncbi:zona pellucida sperm-binding protein 3 [Alosa pseudoharengus]|uniref:zona pellucida sperm-binding protein 3 n=1 Tax=Alosa pseudoharengus TaxID=34774 RepID=UPI003F8CB0B4